VDVCIVLVKEASNSLEAREKIFCEQVRVELSSAGVK